TRLGSNPTDLGDLGRIGDDLPTGQIGDNLPGGRVGDNIPTGQIGDNIPGGRAGDNLPGGRADDLGHGPSASHEPPTGGRGGDGPGGNGDGPSGPHDPTPPHHNDPTPPRDGDHGPNGHADDGAHHGADEGVPPRGSDDGAPHGDRDPNESGPGGHDPEGTSPHDPTNEGAPHADRDVREPSGSLADDAARREAAPITQIGDTPMPPPGPGNKFLGQLPESRLTRDADGLITHIDGRNFEHFLKDLSFQRSAAYKEAKELGTFPRKQVGACVGAVMDLRTGMIFEGINGKFDNIIPADRVHPTIEARHNSIGDPPPAPDHPLGHAEVKAANELLWEREKLGLPTGEAALAELRASIEFPYLSHRKTGLPGRPAAFCANCDSMLKGVDSLHGRFTGNPPTDELWIP
ncbi:hypothetical protein ACF07T_41605, partial [Streptomyces sp. NPDC015184]